MAASVLAANYTFGGRISVPLLAVDGTGDDWATPSQGDYAERVAAADSADKFRMLWVARPGHCNFASAERIAALNVLVERVDSGGWPELAPAAMNRRTVGAAFLIASY